MSRTSLALLGDLHAAGVRLEPVADDEVDWLAERDPTEEEVATIKAHAPGLVTALRRVYLDFETVSLVNLPDTGAAAYAADPSTRVLILCWAVGMGEVQTWLPGERCPDQLRQAIEAGYVAVAHSFSFDQNIWRAHMVQLGWPRIGHDQWSCTAARARAARYPAGLKHLAERLDLRHQKDAKGRLLIAKANSLAKMGKTLLPEDMQAFIEYCIADTKVLRELDYALRELDEQDRAVWALDARMNLRGLPVDLNSARRLDAIRQTEDERLIGVMQSLVGLAPTHVQKLLDWLRTHGTPLANMQQATLEGWLATHGTSGGRADDASLPLVERVVRSRLEFASSASSKLLRFLAAAMPARGGSHRIHGCFQWHGAHTGRWAGRIVQPQNFPRIPEGFDVENNLAALVEGRDGVGTGAAMNVKARLAACMRALIQAPNGYMLVVCDFSQIEARVLNWLAGGEGMLATYHRYDAHHRDIDDPYVVTAHALGSNDRQFGKMLVLSAGFGASGNRLHQVAPASFGIHLTLPETKMAIAAWRRANPRIVGFWRDLQDTLRAAVDGTPGVEWGVRRIYPRGAPVLVRVVRDPNEDTLRVILPSGRHLVYHRPRMTESEMFPDWFDLTYQQVKGADWQDQRGWHGLATENVVQSVAYDLMADKMLRIDAACIEIIGTVHDEVIALAQEEQAEDVLRVMKDIMATPPDWASDLPLAAEGYINRRYIKPTRGPS